MATSLTGPSLLVEKALPAAPVPRPPQPTSASWRVSVPAACTWGRVMPASAEMAATRPLVLMNSRREEPEGESSCGFFIKSSGELEVDLSIPAGVVFLLSPE